MMPVRSVLFVAALTAASCGSSDRTSSSGELPRDGCRAYAEALADTSRGCFDGSHAAQSETLAMAQCKALTALEGSATTEETFAACAVAQRNAACGFSVECTLPPGRLADGASCVSGVQCQSRWCSTIGSRCGVCKARVPIGGRCAGEGCVVGAHCDSSLTCVADRRSPVGGPCAVASDGPFCEQGLICDSKGTCRAPPKPGESCLGNLCGGAWTRCDPVSRVCFVPGVVLGEGAACGSDPNAVCGPGLVCRGTPAACNRVIVLEPGAACPREFGACGWGECIANHCPTLIADGGTCATDGSLGICHAGASCVDGKCLQPQQIVCK